MINLLVGIATCYVLIKIPFWVLSAIKGGGGSSMIGGLIRGVIAYKTFGLIGGGGGSRAPRQKKKPAEPADPYAKARTDPRGQYMIPFDRIKRHKPRKPPQQQSGPKPAPSRQQRGPDRQLVLPLDGEWPENKPVVQRDGQYRLAMPAQRQPRPKQKPASPEPAQKPDRSAQMALPLGKEWPENRLRWPKPNAQGQYRLPLNVRRQPRYPEPRPRPEPAPQPSPHTAAGPDQQLRLPLGQDWPEYRPRADRSGQYRLPLNVRRQPPPARPTPRPSVHPQAQPQPQRRDRQQQLPLNLPPRRRGGRSSGGTQ